MFEEVEPERDARYRRRRACPELRELRAFVAVAEELHFGRAAARIHIAQSPLSRTIQKLESAIGVALFERNRRSVRLTPAGMMLLESARELLLLSERAVERLSQLHR
jgi:DNA-binding transcriptional LysR family regulator